jgi:putative peptide modification system cyclase
MKDTMAASPNAIQHKPAVSSMLRTVLLCDWADSTQLIETLGDARAVELLQAHDQFLRDTLAITQGRLIDKADGVLALFERPIQALDFALRYQQQMRHWGKQYQQAIQARIGIHVGDVMTWQNEPDQIRAGAKPLEVEGFAKPIAARLMSLAMPGQILMSGMAQSLAQRAQLELGERGQQLRWLVHGRYQFKGVPAPMLVHEVGDPEFSPLRAPVSTPKAWRDIPLWRRPPMLALEALLSVGLIGGILYTTLQSPPAIAFYERDWVVLGDVQNQTQQTLFDDALDTAMRVGLEQSAFVNVISDTQEQDALKRMQREGQNIDRQTGTEIALREGAKAFVLPTIIETGGRFRISAEVIDPNSGVTVYTETAEAKNASKVLPAMDAVLEKLRVRLGESSDLVDRNSKPLELATTASVEALRAYSLGVQAKNAAQLNEARALFEEAIKNDPEFALAYIGLATIDYITANFAGFENNIKLAEMHRSHLTNRESLFFDATSKLLKEPSASLPQWKLLGQLYPDEFRAHYNYAYFSHVEGRVDKDVLSILDSALRPQNPAAANAYYLKGLLQLYQNDYRASLDAFNQAERNGIKGTKIEFVLAQLAINDYDGARKTSLSQNEVGDPRANIFIRMPEILIPLSRGNFNEGLKSAELLDQQAEKINDTSGFYQGIFLSLQSYKPSIAYQGKLENFFNAQSKQMSLSNVTDQRQLQFQLYAAAWMAARTDNIDLAEKIIKKAQAYDLQLSEKTNIDMRLVAEAEIQIVNNDSEKAISLLAERSEAEDSLYLLRSSIERAYRNAGKTSEANAQLRWLANNRGRAYAEFNSANFLQPVNLIVYNEAASVVKSKGF